MSILPDVVLTRVSEARMTICESCDEMSVLKTCNKCGCIMPLKVKLKDAECPIKKWGKSD